MDKAWAIGRYYAIGKEVSVYNMMRPLQNAHFCSITASSSNFNPRNIQYIPPVEIFAFLVLKQNWTFFKGLMIKQSPYSQWVRNCFTFVRNDRKGVNWRFFVQALISNTYWISFNHLWVSLFPIQRSMLDVRCSMFISSFIFYPTVTVFAKFLGLSGLQFNSNAM